MRKPLVVILGTVTLAAAACALKGDDASVECIEYCDLMSENCPDVVFEGDRAACLEACEEYPDEPDDVIGDGPKAQDDNTVQCRRYHASNAASGPNGPHCTHASPDGGGVCVDFKGACGDYCGIVVESCDGEEGAFPDTDACETACNAMAQGTEGETTGDTVHCRLTIANEIVATQDKTLCADALEESSVCVN